jgi:hypothetical protein
MKATWTGQRVTGHGVSIFFPTQLPRPRSVPGSHSTEPSIWAELEGTRGSTKLMKARIERKGGSLVYRGETFPGYNKPKKAPAGDEKKNVVLAKEGSTVKNLDSIHEEREELKNKYGGIGKEQNEDMLTDITITSYQIKMLEWVLSK